jgi:hypothetical protein
MAHSGADERRRFSRIPFDAVAHINCDSGDLYLNCRVIDVSLKGVLLEKPGQWQGNLDDRCRVDLLLEQGQIRIEMQATVSHIDDHSLGFACHEIDLDSIAHLKRLVELNLGDDALLHRELAALITPP